MAYDVQPVGVLATLVANIHEWATEPRLKVRFPASKLYPLIRDNYKEVFSEICRIADNTFLAEYVFTADPNQETVMLPSNLGIIHRIIKKNTTTGLADWEIYTRSRREPSGPVFRLENNILRWKPKWSGNVETLTMEYIPNGMTELAYGTQATPATNSSASFLILDITPSEGYFDPKPNAYLGSQLRVLSAGTSEYPTGFTFFPTQERPVTAYVPNDALGPKVTVSPDFDHNLSAMSYTALNYEIVPDGLAPLSSVIAWRTIMTLHAISGNNKRRTLAVTEYASKFRDIKMALANMDARHGQRWEHDTLLPIGDLWGLL